MDAIESIWRFFTSYPLWARVLAGSGLALTFFTLLLVDRLPPAPVVNAASQDTVPPASDTLSKDQIVFDGRGAVDGFAVKGQAGNLWTGSWPHSTPYGKKGEGVLRFEPGGVLSIRRINTDGRFELVVQQYSYGGRQHTVLPKDDVIAGKRRLHITCQAKVIGGEHKLRFVVNAITGKQLANYTQEVTANEWTPIDAYLQAPATEDAEVRIYDEQITAPSSIQIKDLVIIQRST